MCTAKYYINSYNNVFNFLYQTSLPDRINLIDRYYYLNYSTNQIRFNCFITCRASNKSAHMNTALLFSKCSSNSTCLVNWLKCLFIISQTQALCYYGSVVIFFVLIRRGGSSSCLAHIFAQTFHSR